jgi:class 3 adenylate cyclase
VSDSRRILVVDDTPDNVKLLADLLRAKGFEVCTASSGAEALERLDEERPDLVLLDVVMPEMSGYEVCRRIRADEATRLLPVVMVTALDPSEERVKGIEAGADDFLSKPVHLAELLARVRSLLRIRELHETVRVQAAELAEWNRTLEQRVAAQVAELARLQRLKRFLSPQLADLVSSGGMELLKPHRRRVVVVFADLRGFTPFSETAEPEEVIEVLGEYHAEMGRLIMAHEGTLERFTGDGMMVFFNDPVEVPDPEERAVRMAVAMREAAAALQRKWLRLGHDLGLGIGIHTGYATLGAIGFEERWDYAAIGTVTNQAARLCGEAEGGQILVSDRFLGSVERIVDAQPIGELTLRGLARPVAAHNILRLKETGEPSNRGNVSARS